MKRLLLAVVYVLGLQSAASATVLTIGQLEAEINAAINTNGNQAITGSILNGVLTDMTQSLSVVTLPVTAAGAVTSGGVPYFSSSIAMASSALLTANALMVGGGAGLPPATVPTGLNVLTALGVNVGSAGAFVVNGGVLGKPSSGDGTNITNINAATLGGATFAAPGAIGGTTPGAGTFTAINGPIGTVTPNAGTFTTVFDTNEEVNGGGHFYGVYSGSYPTTDGVVVDYVSPNGRFIVGASDNVCAYNAGPTSPTLLGCFTSTGLVAPALGFKLVNTTNVITAPTFTSGACTGSIGTTNGTAAFTFTTGSGSCGSTATIGLPSATTGWNCSAYDLADGAGFQITATTSSQTSVVFTHYSIGSSPAASNFSTTHTVQVSCTAY